LERLVVAIRAGGAVAESVEVARGFIQHGLEALGRLPGGPERLALAEIAWSVVERGK
jgi:geranylgeranyl pyrophosphate synthase